ncbi:TPA: hypothetical protein I7213_09615 [Vibrio vulnificus]|nr:hypothetical protein [Vibrio vulnificus]HDY7578940.1 hypothetical protein [Vibrio vulnificus]
MNKLTNATSALASLVLLALVVYFWVWLYLAQSFAFGMVEEILPTRSEYSVVILKHYKDEAVAMETSQLGEVKTGSWVLLRGEQWNTEQPILFAESFISLPTVNVNHLLSPQHLLPSISTHTLATMGFGLLLLFLAGRLLKIVYFALLASTLAFTLWHGIFVANTMGWLMIGTSEQALLYVSVLLFSALTAFNTVPHQQWPSRVIAAILAYAVGEVVLRYFGVDAPMALVAFIAASAWLPVLFTAVFAAFLLANALSAPLLVSYMVMLLCLLISLSRLRFAVERQVVRHLSPQLSRRYVKLKRQLSPQLLKATALSGKVSLNDALKKRGVL